MVTKMTKTSVGTGTKKAATAGQATGAGKKGATATKKTAAPPAKATAASGKKTKTAPAGKAKAAPAAKKAKAAPAGAKAKPKAASVAKTKTASAAKAKKASGSAKTVARKKPAAEQKPSGDEAVPPVIDEEEPDEGEDPVVEVPENPDAVDVIDEDPVAVSADDDDDDLDEPIDVVETDAMFPARKKSSDVVRLEPLQQYLSEIRRYPLLEREEERAIAIRYVEDGTAEAAHKLVTANLRLVVKIALDYRRYWMNLLDLIQEGNVGLMQAVKNFDPYKNVKLSSYASFWIKAYILKFIMDNWSLVKIGSTQAQRKLFFNLRKEQERLRKLGVDASAENIAKSLSVKETDVVEMSQRMAGSEFSLDAPVGTEGEDTHMDFLTEDVPDMDDRMADFQVQNIFSKKLKEFRTTLNAKDAYLFDNRLVADNPLTLQEIGETYGVTRERIRQIESRLMRKLKDYMLREIPELQDFNIQSPGEH